VTLYPKDAAQAGPGCARLRSDGLFLALTLFQHLIDSFHNPRPRLLVADLLGVTASEYTTSQMTFDLRRLRLKGLLFSTPRTNHYFVTPNGWKVARLFSRLAARVFRPARHVHGQRGPTVVPSGRFPGLPRPPARRVELSGFPANQGFLKCAENLVRF
jgi:hypothetical protein